MDKVHSHMASKVASVSRQQGGSNLNQGPDGAQSLKASGDAVTHSNHFTKQDQSREQGGGPKNKMYEV